MARHVDLGQISFDPSPLPDWFDLARASPKKFVLYVKKAAARAMIIETDQSHRCQWHKQLQEWSHVNLMPEMPFLEPDKESGYQCPHCDKILHTKTALRNHVSRFHASTAHPTWFAEGETCQICMHNFSSYNRLVTHLVYSKTCCRAWAAAVPPLTAEQAANNRAEVRRLRAENTRSGRPPNWAD